MRSGFLYIVCAAVLSCLSPALAAAQGDRGGGDSTTVIIAGSGVRFVRPNFASLVVGFDAIDSTMSRAAQRVALRADSIRNALVKLGIPRDSVVSASSWYWWRERVDSLSVETATIDTAYYWNGRARVPSGMMPRRRPMWRVRDRLQVRMSNPAIVGRVFDAMLALGISDIGDIRFTRSNDPAMADTLLQEAARDARRRAELLASATGMRIERLIELNTQPIRSYYERGDDMLSGVVVTGAGVGGSGESLIRPADLRVAVSVFTRWRLVQR